MDRRDDLDRDFAAPLEEANHSTGSEDAAHGETAKIVMPMPDGAPPPPFEHPHLGPPSDKWAYHNSEGRLIGYVSRFDPKGLPKEYRPLTLWHDGLSLRWEWKFWPYPRPLYGLEQLAAKPTAKVIVVEGEKCAEAAPLIFPHAVVVTSSGGQEAPIPQTLPLSLAET
jgi:hypothetical protein